MRKLGIICLFFIVLAGCTKKTNTIFKKVNIGMQRSEVEKLIGKGDNVNIPYKEENMAYIYTYINDTLTAITYEPINKNKKDSTLSIGILDKFIFQTVRGGTATLIGVSIGNFSINCSESTSFIKPLLNDQDLLTYGVSSSHIFCVTGALDTERKSIIAKKN